MKVTLIFGNDEQVEAHQAINASKWVSAMLELDQWLRAEAKYNESRTEKEIDVIYEVRERIQQEMNEHGLRYE